MEMSYQIRILITLNFTIEIRLILLKKVENAILSK